MAGDAPLDADEPEGASRRPSLLQRLPDVASTLGAALGDRLKQGLDKVDALVTEGAALLPSSASSTLRSWAEKAACSASQFRAYGWSFLSPDTVEPGGSGEGSGPVTGPT